MLLKPSPLLPMPSPISLVVVARFFIASTSFLRKPLPPLADVQGTVDIRPNDKSYGYPRPIIGSVRVVRVLYQLVQHPVAVLGANHFVQVPETLVDLEILSVCIDGVFQQVPNLCM